MILSKLIKFSLKNDYVFFLLLFKLSYNICSTQHLERIAARFDLLAVLTPNENESG